MRRLMAVAGLSFLHLVASAGYCSESANQSEVQLTLRAREGQTVFQQGELIDLELSFTTSVPHKYQISPTAHHRWAFWKNLEGIQIQPQSGWDDPLDLYYRARNFQFWSGSIFSAMPEELSAEPALVHVDLNEWVRFNRPGKYRVSVKSSHVSKLPVEAEAPTEAMAVDSNELLLTIVPASKDWAQRTLSDALAILDATEPATYSAQGDALRRLKYLGTADAAHAMLQHWRQKTEWRADLIDGLAGSLAREAALTEMKALLVSPSFPVDGDFLTTMAMLAIPPDTKQNEPALLKDIAEGYRRDLKLAMASKSGEAWTVSLQTLSSPPSRDE